ncbi:MAG: phosphoenolpyruvate--protein phosphotransferase [Alphaproteobacteria bacterium]|nr:phosphoenolpyruvate--protein phosphotransferase [Alphaproteobacteria bacterium]
MALQATREASRRLLRRVRDVMAIEGAAQDRLNRVVRIIASEMVAEVCSIYLMRGTDILELFATEGLKATAVHVTRLKVGEGVVGDIAANARPLALADAQSHPKYAYRPETGEEIYHSLMGVPLLHGGRILGVLVVQNRSKRSYTEDETETLQIVAMVLAEVAATGALNEAGPAILAGDTTVRSLRLDGTVLNAGLAIGVAVLHEPRVAIDRLVADDPEAELQRLTEALRGLQSAVDDLLATADAVGTGEHRDVLESYRMFARDAGWLARLREAIRGGLSVEAAVRKVQDDNRVRMRQVRDPYIRERLDDLDDLSNRLVMHLVGEAGIVRAVDLPENAILVARGMGPAELLDYDRQRLAAVVLETGSHTAHVAIVARALDLPVIGQVDHAMSQILANDTIIVDGDHGQVFVRPSVQVQQAFALTMQARDQRRQLYVALRDLPAETRDGVAIELNLNAGLLADFRHLHDSGAAGVGLYRTEIPFMAHDQFPDVEAQTGLYRRVLELAAGKPVVFRTLDIGGDKLLPYWRGTREENPAMGWRAIRVALDRPFLLRRQLRALLAASAGQELRVMFPMVAQVAELEQARAILDVEIQRLSGRGGALPTMIRVGAMLEVPSLAWQLPALGGRVDFLSVGSNDLLQFLFASDRGNARLAQRYDPLSPAALAFLHWIATQCEAADLPVGFCGELAAQPLEAMALIGLGFRSLSAPPTAIGAIKMMVRSVTVEPLRRYLATLFHLPDASVRGKLRAYAADHNVAI